MCTVGRIADHYKWKYPEPACGEYIYSHMYRVLDSLEDYVNYYLNSLKQNKEIIPGNAQGVQGSC